MIHSLVVQRCSRLSRNVFLALLLCGLSLFGANIANAADEPTLASPAESTTAAPAPTPTFGGEPYLPAPALAQTLGAELKTSDSGRTAKLTLGKLWLECSATTILARRGSGAYLLTACPVMLGNQLYLPIRTIAAALGEAFRLVNVAFVQSNIDIDSRGGAAR